MKYKYTLEESVNGTDIYCRADLPNTADQLPKEMIHTPDLEAVFDFIRQLER